MDAAGSIGAVPGRGRSINERHSAFISPDCPENPSFRNKEEER